MAGMQEKAKWLMLGTAALTLAARPAIAQDNSTQNTIGAIGNLFGALAQAGAKANAQKKWSRFDPQITACVGNMFAVKNVTMDQIVAGGLAPDDQRIVPIVTFCKTVLATELKQNFPCNTPNSKGAQVATTCSEVYARDENGGFTRLTRDEFIRAAGAGEKVLVATLENVDANAARLQEEQRQAAAERARFLASPEGKRQAAAESARVRAAAAAQSRANAERAAEQANDAKIYPFIAEVNCQVQGSSVTLAMCISWNDDYSGEIVVNNGRGISKYNVVNGRFSDIDKNNGYYIKLSRAYEIIGRNVNYDSDYRPILWITIKNRSGKIIKQSSARAGQIVRVSG